MKSVFYKKIRKEIEKINNYDIILEYEIKDDLYLYAVIDNPNKDNKLILQKNKK